MLGVVAAGAPAPAALRGVGIERIPLLRVNGETILERTCRCLVHGAGCGRICVLAPDAVPLPAMAGVERTQYTGALIDDFLHCIEQEQPGGAIILAGGDMPLLTPEAVAALAGFGAATDADVVYPVVDKPTIEQRFPGTRRTYVKLGPSIVSGGNMFWLKRDWVVAHGPLLKRLFAKRKNPAALARILGLGFILRLLLGRLDIPYLESHLSPVFHGKLRAAVMPHAEIAVDLDKPADLDTFQAYLDPWR